MVNVIHGHVTFTTMKVEAAYCPSRGTTLSNMSRPIPSQNCHTATSNRER